MKLGFVTAIVPELSLEKVLALAHADGFACVEVMCWPVGRAERRFGGVTHLDVTGFTRAQAEDVNALCAKHGVSFSALGYYPPPPGSRPQTRTGGGESFEARHRGSGKTGAEEREHVHRTRLDEERR